MKLGILYKLSVFVKTITFLYLRNNIRSTSINAQIYVNATEARVVETEIIDR